MNWLIYIIIYSGYLKLLFPGLGKFFLILQLMTMCLGLISTITYNKGLIIDRETFLPIGYTSLALVILSISVLWTNNVGYALEKMGNMIITALFMFFLYFIALSLDNRERCNSLLSSIVKGNLFFLTIYVLIHLSEIRLLVYEGLRGGGTDANPIWIARIAADTVLIITLYFNTMPKLIRLLCVMFLLFIIFIMGSKGALIAFLLTLFVYCYKNGDGNIKHRLLAITATMTVLGLGLLIATNFSNDYIHERFSVDSVFVSLPGYRVDRYLFSIRSLGERLLFGHGLGSWTLDYWSQVSHSPIWVDSVMKLRDYPHNMLLEVAYEGGMICIMVLVIAWVRMKKLLNGSVSDGSKIIYFLLFQNIIYSMFSGSITEGNRGIYYYLAILCGLIQNDEGEEIFDK